MVLAVALFGLSVVNAQNTPDAPLTINRTTGLSSGTVLVPDAATRLAFVQQPTNETGGTVISPPITVQLKDNSGHNVLQSGVSITLTISTGTATATLSGTTTRTTNAQGLSTFDDVSIDIVGSYKLKASSTGLQLATSNSFSISVGPAARLEIQTQPSATATAGVIFSQQPVLWVEDAGGNRLTGDNSTVVTAARLAGVGTLQGTLTAKASKGIVTFSNLSHNVAGTLTILFSATGLSPDTSSAIVVTPAAAAKVVFIQQPSNATAGAVIVPPVTAGLKDAFGNDVTTSGTSITLSLSSGTGTLSGTLTRSTVSGVAIFDNLRINLGGSKVLTASSGSLTLARSATFDISAANPKLLVFVQQPTNTVASSVISPPVSVQVRDSLGNNIPSNGVAITIALASGTGTLGGTATRLTDAGGLATFSDLRVNLAGTKTLSASSSGLQSATSSSFTIAPGAASQLAFAQQPTNVTVGSTITPAVKLEVRDSDGNAVHVAGISITVSLSTGTGTLSGTIPQLSDASGLATFNNLSINLAGDKMLTASGTGLVSAVSSIFTVLTAPASKLVFTTSPGGGVAGTAFPVQPVVTLEDAFGNPVSGVAQSVTLAIQNNSGPGATLLGTRTGAVNTATGQLIFTDIAIDKIGVGYTLTATGSTVSTIPGVVVSAPFAVTAAPANVVRVENASNGTGTILGPQNVTAGTSLTVYAISRDAYNNFVANVPADEWILRDTTGGVRSTDLVMSVDRKSATFTGRATGTGVIAATVGGLTSVPSGVLTVVVAGSPTKIRVETAANGSGVVVPSQSIISGTPITVFAIGRDAGDNFKSNLAADTWGLIGKTGGVADGDLAVSADRKSAVFTGKLLGSSQIRATSGTLVPTSSGTLTVIAGAASTLATSAGTPQSANVGTPFPAKLGARVRDAAGNPVKGVQVTWTAPTSGASGVFAQGGATAVTDTNGIALSGVFTANAIAGSYSVSATVTGIATPANFSLTNLAGRPAHLATVAGSPQNGKINTPFATLFAASVKDSSGNGLSGATVTFTAPSSGPGGTFTGGVRIASSITNTGGIATAPVFTANSTIGHYLVRGTAVGISDTALFDLSNIAGQIGTVQAISGTPQSTPVSTPFASRLGAAVRDSSGNPLAGISVIFTAPSSGASGRFAKGIADTAVTDTSGKAMASILTANTIAGPFTVFARTSGTILPASFSLTNEAGPVDTFLIEAAGGGSIGLQIALVPFNIRVIADDRFGNIATQFAGTAEIRSNGVLTQASGSTGLFNAGILPSHTVAFRNTGRFILMATRTGGAETGRTDTFQVVNPAPTVRSIVPAFGRRGQTLTVVISGSGFISGATAVTFGDRIATSTTVDSSNQLSVTITIDSSVAEGARDVIVFNGPPGGGAVTLPGAFFIGSNPIPSLTSLTPNRGTVLNRLTVILKGSNFVGGLTRIDMGAGILINAITVDSSSQLSADVSITNATSGGARKVVAINDPPGGGTSDSVSFIINAPPTPFPMPDSPPDEASALDTSVSLRWFRWLTTGITYRLQVSTDPQFGSMVLNDSTITDTSRILSSLQGGVTYYWRVIAWNQVGSSQPSPTRSFTTTLNYPATFSLLDTVAYPTFGDNGQYQLTDYRLVGLPGNSNGSIASFLQGVRNVDWRVYWDNGAQSDYLVPFTETSDFNCTAGRSFWILHRGAIIFNMSIPSIPLDSTMSVRIPLHPGWNLITNPYASSVRWPSVQSANGPGSVSELWTYNGSFSRITTFAPFKGYLFDNAENRNSLRIPYAAAIGKSTTTQGPGHWQVDIELKSGSFDDYATSIGVSPAARQGRDPLDLRMPRSVGTTPGVFLLRPEWDSTGDVFATDFRPDVSSLESWPIDVRALVRQPATLSFAGVSRIQQEYKVLLIDDDHGNVLDLRADSVYRFTPPLPVSHMRVVVGTANAIAGIVDNLLPREFVLGNNFPNPFNPTTTVPLAIPRISNVDVGVYSVLGEEIRTLYRGSLEAGRHYFVWEGNNAGGRQVSSGVYFVIVRIDGGKQLAGRMLLLK